MAGKKESSFMNMVVTLFVITLIAGLALGGVYNATKEPIALAKKAKAEAAVKAVIPEFDELKTYKVLAVDGTDSLIFNDGFKAGELVGTAIESFSNMGYDPTQIRVVVGFSADGKILNTSVVQHKETPGLGTKMKDEKFKAQFQNKDLGTFKLLVKKDGGSVDAITAATISSRAFCDALNRAHTTLIKEGGNK
jgi:Na+-translocating ferredoxin:NAD+ oxidoreductase subunit G